MITSSGGVVNQMVQEVYTGCLGIRCHVYENNLVGWVIEIWKAITLSCLRSKAKKFISTLDPISSRFLKAK